ncbi:MAG: hypothetical protein R3D25_13690 [Geminicoccaceae bacterium]
MNAAPTAALRAARRPDRRLDAALVVQHRCRLGLLQENGGRGRRRAEHAQLRRRLARREEADEHQNAAIGLGDHEVEPVDRVDGTGRIEGRIVENHGRAGGHDDDLPLARVNRGDAERGRVDRCRGGGGDLLDLLDDRRLLDQRARLVGGHRGGFGLCDHDRFHTVDRPVRPSPFGHVALLRRRRVWSFVIRVNQNLTYRAHLLFSIENRR